MIQNIDGSTINHQTGIEHALEGATLAGHTFYRRQHNMFHYIVLNLRGNDGSRRICTHAAGIGPFVILIYRLVILRGRQWQHGLAIGKGDK